MEKRLSTGKCHFCNGTFSREEMTQHLKSCEPRKALLRKLADKPGSRKTGVYHLFVEGRYQTAYWMHLEIHSDAILHELDRFLRDIWLECCGHLSAFTIEKKSYLFQQFEKPFFVWGPQPEEYDMDIELEKVLRPRIKFYYEYDFGTPTELALRVVSYYERRGRGKQIQLLARNDPPLIFCAVCGKKRAILICTQCQWSGKGWLCESCAPNHECDEEMFLPVVNSPRTGQCGYAG